MGTACIHHLFELQTDKTPHLQAVVCDNFSFTYKELNEKSNQLAHHLINKGVKPDDRIAICCDRSLLLIVTLLAIQKAGGAYVPLDPEYPDDRLRYMLNDCGAKILLCQQGLEHKFSENELDGTELITISTESHIFSSNQCQNPVTQVTQDNFLYVIYTSGSTGKPKGSLVYHRGAVNLLNWYCRELAFDEQSRLLLMTSFSFDLTQKNIYAPLITGGCLYLLHTQHYDANIITDTIERFAITSINCTPTAFYGLVADNSPSKFKKLISLKSVVLGGEPIIVKRFLDWLQSEFCNAEIINSYGPTECTDVVSFFRMRDFNNFIQNSVPIGWPIDGIELFIMDESLNLCPVGEEGELCIAGIGVGAGYINLPELTAERFILHPEVPKKIIYRSGDRARFREDGCIQYMGRIDQQVKVRGFRIETGEIEAKLESVDSIREAVVLAKRDKSGENRLVAYLVQDPSLTHKSVSEIRAELQKDLPDFMLPTAWVFMTEMPLSPNGKLDRKALPDPEMKRPELSQPYIPPQSELEQYLSDLWCQLLNIDRVGIRDPFFELGGTSIKAIQFVAQIGKKLNDSISIASFFASPTVEGCITTLEINHKNALLHIFPEHTLTQPKQIPAQQRFLQGNSERSETDSIAIIGMAARLPGAEDVDTFWHNLRNGVESVNFSTDDDLRAEGVSEDDIADSDYVRSYFSANELDAFDADFFGYQPREAETMDPQHRLFLELAWTALDNAGYSDTSTDTGLIGIFGGVARNSYLTSYIVKHPLYRDSLGDFQINNGNDKDFPSTRVAYKLNLKGPSVNIQTACSTSGVALHLACQSLKLGECDIAIVGGCRVLLPTKTGYRYIEGSALSADGHLYAFDARATGMVRGSGGAFVVIKRLSDAVHDGDCIRGVIKSTAINNDGNAKAGFTAPSVEGQAAVITTAIQRCGIESESIGYIETHGTATALGDPIEVMALTRAYRQFTEKKQFCWLGSVKTNIGHLDAGAAVTGIIKTLLAIEHGEIPKSLNYEKPNADIDFINSPFKVNNQLIKWNNNNNLPRRAGVSSFGLGGTNFHTILEQAPLSKNISKQNGTRTWQLITLSAKTETSLNANLAGIATYSKDHKDITLADLAFSLNTCRPGYEHQAVLLCRTGDLIGEDTLVTAQRNVSSEKTPIVFMFPSCEEIDIKIMVELSHAELYFFDFIKKCYQCLVTAPMPDDPEQLLSYLAESFNNNVLLFIFEYSLARTWIEWGIKPSAVYGDGVGKYVAACIAGVFDLQDSLKLVTLRQSALASGDMEFFKESLAKLNFNQTSVPIITCTGEWASKELLADHTFWLSQQSDDTSLTDTLINIQGKGPFTYLEVGPGQRQANSIIDHQSSSKDLTVIASLDQSRFDGDAPHALTDAVAKMWLSGHKINWAAYYAYEHTRKVPLPTFRFDRRRYLLDLHGIGPFLIKLEAASDTELTISLSQWATYLQSNPDVDLAKLAVQSFPEQKLRHRISFNALNFEDAHKQIIGAAPLNVNALQSLSAEPSVVFMFPGGGAQYLLMGLGLYERFGQFRSSLDKGISLFASRTGYDLKRVWFASSHEQAWAQKEMERPSIQLPAIFILEMAIAHLWQHWGLIPGALLGHSLGENTAACLAGVLSYEDALGLVTLRGRLFEKVEPGGMLSIALSPEALAPYIGNELDIAIINAPEQSTVSGRLEPLRELQKLLERDNVDAQLIPIATAAHSRLLEPVLKDFEDYLRRIKLSPPTIPFISNVTGTWITDQQATDPSYWVRHLRNTVRFSDGIKTLLKQENMIFLEVGPGKILGSVVKLQAPNIAEKIVASLRHGRESISDQFFIFNSISRLWVGGASFDWSSIEKDFPGRYLSLPLQPPSTGKFQVCTTPVLPEPIQMNVTRVVDMPATQKRSVIVKSRPEVILEKLRAIIQDMSGINGATIDPDMTFLNMGFDSLFLTQVNLRMKKTFQVKITLRQLSGDAPTLNALSAYIDKQLPPDALRDELQSAPVMTATASQLPPSAHEVALSPAVYQTVSLGGDSLQQAIALQIQASTALLAHMQGGMMMLPSMPSPAIADTSCPIHPLLEKSVQPQSAPQLEVEAPAFGPFKPLQKSIKAAMNDKQKTYLAQFIQDYEQKTKKSKALAQEYRSYYADPRTVMGFKTLWKEITYTIVAERSKGSHVWDIDGNEYVDCMGGFGAIFFGHAPDFIMEAVRKQTELTVDYGPQSPLVGPTAKLFCEITGMERASFCNTGSEASLAAIRLSRTVTGNDLIVIFQGDYHGIFDEVLVRAQDIGGERRNVPVAPGIPAIASTNILVLDYGDPKSLEIIKERGGEIAGVMVEPVQSRNPELQPREFLHTLRELTTELDVPLIFDEIITGFRLHPKGAQGWFDVEADIACYGKVVGGGLPIGVIAGKAKYMDALDGGHWQFGDDSFPEVGVTYFAGTFIRHPLAIAAVNAVLKKLIEEGPELQKRLNKKTALFAETINRRYRQMGVPIELVYFGSAFFIRYKGDSDYEGLFGHHLRYYGAHHIWGTRPGFLTLAHTDEDIALLVKSFEQAALAMQRGGFLPTEDNFQIEYYPWTALQSELWLAIKMGEKAGASYNEQVMFEIDTDIEPSVFELVVDKVTNRHPSLRAAVSDDEGLTITRYMTPNFTYYDFSNLAESVRNQKINELVQQNIDAPFDFNKGPLLRVVLIKSGVAKNILCVCASHLVCDGWSLEIVMEDFAAYYTGLCQARYMKRRSVPSLADFIAAHKAFEESDDYKTSRDYWLSIFKDNLPNDLDLPLDSPRPRIRSYSGGRLNYYLDRSLNEPMRKFAKDHGCTSFILMLAVYKLLLNRLSGQNDIVVGIPTAGQPFIGMNDVVAHDVAFLPMRSQIDSSQHFDQFLSSLRDKFYDAKDNQGFAYGEILKELPIPRDSSRLPLVTASFNLDMAYNPLKFDNVLARFIPAPHGLSKYDLFFTLTDEGQDLLIEVDRNADIIETKTIDRWVKHYENLLREIISNPNRALSEIPILDGNDKSILIKEWNATDSDFPSHSIFTELISQQAAKTPESIAVEFEKRILTYKELDERSNKLAHLLRDNGIGRGSLVGLFVDRSIGMLVSLLATAKAGGAYVPLDPGFPADRIAYMLENSGASVVISQEQLLSTIPDNSCHLILIDDMGDATEATNAEPIEPASGPEDPAYIIYTSGSTGKPKGVVVPHRGVTNFLCTMAQSPGISSNDVLLAVTTLSFDIAVLELYLPLITGAKVVIANRDTTMDGIELLNLIRETNTTIMQATPATWRMLIASGWDKNSMFNKNFKVLVGGEALSRDLADQLVERTGEVWNMYGPTETTVWSTCHPIREINSTIVVGRPIANTQLYILDANLQPVPIGVPGELLIGGSGVALGYWQLPAMTDERFIDNPFFDSSAKYPSPKLYKTGDLARYRSDGTVDFIGRNDNQVKVRGYRIELGEIEYVLMKTGHLHECIVIVREDVPGDQRIVAYCVPGSATTFSSDREAQDTLKSEAQKSLPTYMIPHQWVALPSLPKTLNGKIERKMLPPPGGSSPVQSRTDKRVPETERQKQIFGIWKEVLKTDDFGIDEDFFQLGGHSLLVAQIISRIQKAGLKPPTFRDLFTMPTVEKLAQWIDEHTDNSSERSAVVTLREDREKAPLSLMQQRIWYIEQLTPGTPVYNLPAAFRFHGTVNITLIRECWQALFDRHSALRTYFDLYDGMPIQRILPKFQFDMPLLECTLEQVRKIMDDDALVPFELSTAPLLRAKLFELGPDDHVLYFVVHHAIWDGWCFDIFMRDFKELYEAKSAGRPVQLPVLTFDYADYSIWHRRRIETGGVLDTEKQYWLKQLEGQLPVLELPRDFDRPEVMSYHGDMAEFSWSADYVKTLNSFAKQHGCTLQMLLLTAYKIFLHQLTGMNDLIVGAPIQGRTQPEVEDVIGFFVNTLVLRTKIDSESLSFSNMIAKVRDTCLDAYAHQNIPFEVLVEELKPPRDFSRTPIFQNFFTYQDVTNRQYSLGDLPISQINVKNSVVAADINLWLRVGNSGLAGAIDFSTDLFKRSRVDGWLELYRQIIEKGMSNPEIKISELPKDVLYETSHSYFYKTQAVHSLSSSTTSQNNADSVEEQYLLSLWKQVLKVKDISPHDNFFDIGGHSLLLIEMVAQIQRETGHRLSLRLFLLNTLGQIASHLKLKNTSINSVKPDTAVIGGRESTPFYFKSNLSQLYGVIHYPKDIKPNNIGVLVCAPIGHEYIRSHWILRQLVDQLCSAGYSVLRFDYSGCGDSSGANFEGGVQQWLQDTRQAEQELRAKSGCDKIVTVGVRFGAMIASLASLDSALVFWDPVEAGATYISGLTTLEQKIQHTSPSPQRESSPFELIGFDFGEQLINEIEALDSSKLSNASSQRPVIILSQDLQEPDYWTEITNWSSAVLSGRIVQALVKAVQENIER
jgi:amino acid adenylation domain-containing protein